MTDWFARPLLDLHAVDLDGAPRVEYLLCQRFRYEYDAPAFDVRQRIVAVPRKRHGSLHLRAHHVDVAVTGADAWSRRRRVDRRGNTVVDVHVAEVRCAVEFTVAAVVHRDGPLGDTRAASHVAARSRPPPVDRAHAGRPTPCRQWPRRCAPRPPMTWSSPRWRARW